MIWGFLRHSFVSCMWGKFFFLFAITLSSDCSFGLKRRIEIQHDSSPVCYRLDHRGKLLGMLVLVVCIRARWVIHTPMSAMSSSSLTSVLLQYCEMLANSIE